MYKKSWRAFSLYVLIFLVFWCFIIPISVKSRLQKCFFNSQVPIFYLGEKLKSWQISNALSLYSKKDLLENVRELIKENAYLKLKLSEQKDQVDLAQKILKIEKIAVGENFKLIAARVIHRSFETWNQWVVIDKGSKYGIKVGQGVVCTDGIVGRIKEVKDFSACVELITDPNFKILVKMESDEGTKILQGMAQEKSFIAQSFKAKLLGVKQEDDPLCPQNLETSSLGQQFPNHIYVGKLLDVKKEGSDYIGGVELGSYLENLHEVGILIPTLIQ